MIEEGSRTVVIPDPEIESDILAVKNRFRESLDHAQALALRRRRLRWGYQGFTGERQGRDSCRWTCSVLVDGTCYSDQRGLDLKSKKEGIFL